MTVGSHLNSNANEHCVNNRFQRLIQERSLPPFLLLSTMQNMCKLVKAGQSQQIQNSATTQKDDEHKARIINEMDGYSGLFSMLIHTILSEAKNSNILCMSEVTKYHCIIIHKVLSIRIQKTARSVQTCFFPNYYNVLQLKNKPHV